MSMLLKNPNFNPVGQNTVARLRIAPGNVLTRVPLAFGGTNVDIATHVSRLVARVNEKIIYDLSGAEAVAVQTSKGLPQTDDKLVVDFIDPLAATAGSMFMGALDLSRGANGLDLEVHFSAAPADVTLDSLREVLPAAENSPGIGLVRAYTKVTVPVTAAGKFTHLPTVGERRPSKIQRLWFKGANVTAVGIKKSSLHIFEDVLLADNNADLKEHGRVPQAGYFMVDFVKNGFTEESLFTGNARSMEYIITTDDAGDVTIITEEIIALSDL